MNFRFLLLSALSGSLGACFDKGGDTDGNPTPAEDWPGRGELRKYSTDGDLLESWQMLMQVGGTTPEAQYYMYFNFEFVETGAPISQQIITYPACLSFPQGSRCPSPDVPYSQVFFARHADTRELFYLGVGLFEPYWAHGEDIEAASFSHPYAFEDGYEHAYLWEADMVWK